MKHIEDFEPFVLTYAPYTPTELIQHVTREAIVDFMRLSKIAVASLEFDTQEKVADYMLEVPDCRRFLGVKDASATIINSCGREHYERLRNGEDGHYQIILRKGEHPFIEFHEPERKPRRVKINYYWAIGRDDCEIPDFIYEDFMDVIVAGAMIRLAGLPEHEHIARMVQMYQATWFDGLQRAKIEKSGGKARRIISTPLVGRRGVARWL